MYYIHVYVHMFMLPCLKKMVKNELQEGKKKSFRQREW